MRKGLLAVGFATVGMVFSLAGCNQGGNTPAPETHTYEVAISNKAEMQAEWFSNGQARSLAFTIKKDGAEQNAFEAIQEGDLVITSSNTTVATVVGSKVSPVKTLEAEGKSTITATYGDKSDSVEVTIKPKLSPKQRFGTTHEGE